MAELKVWCINGYDDDGDFEIELYSTYEKAKHAFDSYVKELAFMYGEYDEDEDEYESVCKVDGDNAEYDCDNHYGYFWISELEVR